MCAPVPLVVVVALPLNPMSNPVAKRQIEERNKARMQQAGMAHLWESCAKFCCPEKVQTARNLAQVADENYRSEPQRVNDTAISGLRILSGGIKSWVCPGPSSAWFGWVPHASLESDTQVKDWLADCTDRADKLMEAAGFYTESHLVFQDLGVFGTAGLFIDSTGEAPLTIQALSPTQFTFAVDFDRKLSAVRVTYHLSADAMLEKFGDNVPDTVRADIAAQKGETMHEFIHAVIRRPNAEMLESEAYLGNPLRMPWASYWIHVQREVVMEEGGYEEMPFVVPRWRIVTGTNGLYGVAPAMDALASARGVNLMDMLLATTAELAINPRIKAPPGTGAVDLSPGGITEVDAGMEGPTEWLSESSRGGHQVGENFIQRKEAQVLRAFHADLFEQLAPIAQKREMTNGLVDALQRESIARISPAMGQLATDYVGPAMHRIFMILRRKGLFAEPPDSAFYTDGAGARYLIFPRVVQTSRMAQALNSRKVFAYRAAMERLLPLAELKPELMDLYNWEVMHRDLDRGDGMPIGWHLTDEEVQQLREARAQQQQQMQQQALIAEMATKQPEALASAAQAMGAAA